ncbi:MAG: AMP-binding protein [Actinomycetota bacterium]
MTSPLAPEGLLAPAIPSPALEDLVLGEVLSSRARSHGDETFLRFRDGELTYREVDLAADRLAAGLAGQGVGPGDHVALMLPNSADMVELVFALARLGAIAVPINTAYKGDLLRHVLDSSDATSLIVDAEYLDRVAEVAGRVDDLRFVAVRGGDRLSLDRFPVPAMTYSRLTSTRSELPQVEVAFSDTQAIMYTSGTTGRSKGAIVPHSLALICALDSLRFVSGGSRTIYCPLPLFHAAGLWDGMMAALLSGASIAIVERFSASRFWDDVRHFDAQTAMGVFSMIPILLNQPPTPSDRDNPLQTFYMGKSSLDAPFYERFGAHTVETYTSTEAGIATASPYGEWRVGSMGQAHSERFQVAVVDEHDRAVPPGEPGELVLRPRQPHVITGGYYGRDDVTAACFRNMWFHTGDRAYADGDGYFYFLDRMKDAIRRRGENISAFDMECEINLHPGVLECAAIGVPSELEEEEVKVVVVRRPGSDLEASELAAYCAERLPAFMIPRYIEFVDTLPRTPTGKVAKHQLRAMGDHGLTAATWDGGSRRGNEKAG